MQKIFRPWNPRYVKRNTIIQIVVIALTLLVMGSVWPYNSYHNHDIVKQQAYDPQKDQMVGDVFTKDDKKLQTVQFTKDYIYQMKVYVDAITYDNKDFVYFRLYDENFSCIYSEEIGCSLIAKNGYVLATPAQQVETGKNYYYELIVPQKASFWWMYTIEVKLPTAPVRQLGQAENGILYIDGILNEEQALIADFDYGKSLSVWQIIGYDLLIALAGLASYLCILWGLDRLEPYYETILQKAKWGITGISVLFGGCVWYLSVIKSAFDAGTVDKVVYTLGILVGIAWILVKVWLPDKTMQEKLFLMEKRTLVPSETMISLTWRNALQIVSFGFLFYALCQYVNADVEYLHTNQTRWMLIWMGVALLMIKSHKYLFQKINFIWIALSGLGGIAYCLQQEVGQERYLAKLTVAVVIIWGLVLLQIIPALSKEAWYTINKPYFAVWIAFIIITYIYRYEKNWVFTASLPFLALLLFGLKAEEKKRLLQNFTQGILVSFWLITFYDFLHRPFHYWMYYRYSGMFHTVACTGLYLAVVIGACFALLLGKWKNKKRIGLTGYYELFTLVMAVNYVIFTMSRTALLSIVVDMILVMLLSVWGYRKTVWRMCKEGIVILALVCISFPFAFSAQRMIPAIVNQPQYHRIEDQDWEFAIHEGEAWNSDKYMSVERFISMFTGRIQTGSAESENTEAEITLLYPMDQQADLVASIAPDSILAATAENSEDQSTAQIDQQEEETTDISNGRFHIFQLYLSKVSFHGNPGTILADDTGEEYAHAHNSFIMVFYNFGIVGGILFLVLCVWTLYLSIRIFLQKGKKAGIYLVPFSLLIIFGFTGLTEWTFHPCFSTGYAFLFMIPLLTQERKERETGKKMTRK